MKYFIIKECLNEKIVGTQYPQVWDFVKGYKPDPEHNGVFSLYNMYQKGFPATNPNLSGLKLANGAKFTDFMSGAFADYLFLLSKEAKSVLEGMNLEEHRFYPAKVVSLRKKIERDYIMMKIVSDNIKYVNFKESFFVEMELFSGTPIKTIPLESLDDFYEKDAEIESQSKGSNTLGAISTKMLPSFFNLGLDMFHISNPPRWYISSKLHDKIEESKLTGWEFTEVDL